MFALGRRVHGHVSSPPPSSGTSPSGSFPWGSLSNPGSILGSTPTESEGLHPIPPRPVSEGRTG
eukprot:scaffold1222_cov317-Pavlova_lutheri.AAC.1